MNVNKLTRRSAEAIQAAQQLAASANNTYAEQAHLLYALLTQDEGLIPGLMKKLGADPAVMAGELKRIMSGFAVSGSPVAEVYAAPALAAALDEAEKRSAQMHDEYTSVEHLMLGIISKADGNIKPLLKKYGVTEAGFLAVLSRERLVECPENRLHGRSLQFRQLALARGGLGQAVQILENILQLAGFFAAFQLLEPGQEFLRVIRGQAVGIAGIKLLRTVQGILGFCFRQTSLPGGKITPDTVYAQGLDLPLGFCRVV